MIYNEYAYKVQECLKGLPLKTSSDKGICLMTGSRRRELRKKRKRR